MFGIKYYLNNKYSSEHLIFFIILPSVSNNFNYTVVFLYKYTFSAHA